jgi:hypothetical protein
LDAIFFPDIPCIKKQSMKKILIFFLFLILDASCKDPQFNKIGKSQLHEFEIIDYTCKDGFSESKSIKIYKNGKAYMHYSDEIFHVDYYKSFIVDKNVVDTITKLANAILLSDFDTLYRLDCDKCVRYGLIITSQKEIFYTSFVGSPFNPSTKPLNSFAERMNSIIIKNYIERDSNYNFESRSKFNF